MNPYTFLYLLFLTGVVLSVFHAKVVNMAQRSANKRLEDAIHTEWGNRMATIEQLMTDPKAVENMIANMKTANCEDDTVT